jgi:hypothetical protein
MIVLEHRAHMVELRLNDGRSILCSYGRPVAAFLGTAGYVRTNQKSVTDDYFIELWLSKESHCDFVSQEYLDSLLEHAA